MGNVVMAFTKGVADRADIKSSRWTIRVFLNFIPETIEIATCCMVVPEVVAGVGDPE